MKLTLMIVIAGLAATVLAHTPCISACASDFHKGIASPRFLCEEFAKCISLCDGGDDKAACVRNICNAEDISGNIASCGIAK